ncbi:unnamed protein product [Enterobius vermicularis]|uniref:ANK_REP_REGION domain-containing protein n=1 Tax=Enterobius vermicularis TaxID=51028 RepID=A0A0N4V0T2_ENTVE|nr:unnamed protein product [Enterobius vermicularis]
MEHYHEETLDEYAKNGELDALCKLLSSNPDSNAEKIEAPCENEQLEIVSRLIEQGVDINTTDEDGRTPLWIATAKHDKSMIEKLVGQGANVNATSLNKSLPKKAASSEEQDFPTEAPTLDEQIVELTETPLWLASFKGHADVLEYLLNKGASVDAADKNGVTVGDSLLVLERTANATCLELVAVEYI